MGTKFVAFFGNDDTFWEKKREKKMESGRTLRGIIYRALN